MNLQNTANGWRPEPAKPSTPMREAFGSLVYELRWLVSDTWMLAWRMLMHYRRAPEMLFSSIFGPIMFLLMFNYVFGGAIGGSSDIVYINYLVPGVLIQNNVFNVMQTGVGLADDLQKGVIDRYRSLPMARSAVLGGRVVATTLVSFVTVYWTLGFALAIGMRFHGGLWPAIALPFVVAAFSFGFAWFSALIGASVRDAQTASSVTFFIAIPLTFLSSTFVPVETMPGWLQAFAEVNPVTQAVDLCRNLAQGGPIMSLAWTTGFWIAVMVVVFATASTWRFKRVA